MMSWAATSRTNSFRILLELWFILTACLLVMLLLVVISRVATNDFGIATIDAGATDAKPGTLSVRQAGTPSDVTGPGAFPIGLRKMSVAYAGTTWSVAGARLVPRTEEFGSRPIVIVDAVVANTTPDVTLRIKTSDVTMAWPDGRRDEVDRFEFVDDPAVLTLEPGQSILVTLVFKPVVVVDPVLDELKLEIGERGRVPAMLPLVGPVPEQHYPARAAINGNPAVMIDSVDPERQLGIEPVGATVALDFGPYRAAVGSRLAIVDVVVERASVLIGPVADVESAAAPASSPASESESDPAFLDPDYWQLRDAGEQRSPIRIIDNGATVTLVFAIAENENRSGSEGADDIVLVVAADGSDARTFVVEVPFIVG